MLRIYTNVAAMNSRRMYDRNESSVKTSVQRLSTGMRINSARDDAAGLAIGERMTSQVRGMTAGMRNANDGISLLQTAEGGLAEVTNMLQRMRELSIQAANTATVSVTDRRALQAEVNQLLQEIDRIAETTEFNGVKVLNDYASIGFNGGSDKMAVVQALKASWLEQAESMISTYYGLTPSNTALTVDVDNFTDGAGGTKARATATVGAGVGNITNLTLEIDMADFTNISLPNGGSGPVYYDRIIAHEMVHAVMFDQTDTTLIPTWFMEGAAEFIHGADERVRADAKAQGYSVNYAANLAASVDLTVAWGGNSIDYSASYLAVRYIHAITGNNMAGVMTSLAAGNDLLTAINSAGGPAYASVAAFQTDFRANIGTIVSDTSLANADTGAIGGADAGGGGRITDASNVIPNIENPQSNPTAFNIIWPFETFQNEGPSQFLQFQVGANVGQTIAVGYGAASTKALGVQGLDLVNEAQSAMSKLDAAIGFVSRQRARLGAQQNRLEATVRASEVSVESLSASRSRIRDTDYAKETATLTKGMILSQAATAMLSQAQNAPQLALSLLDQSF